jgi:hypothetical protein
MQGGNWADWGAPGWGGGSNFGEPPWSDALAAPCGCKKPGGLSPWLILGIVVLGLVVVFGNEN